MYVDGIAVIGYINSQPWPTLSSPNKFITPKDEYIHSLGSQ